MATFTIVNGDDWSGLYIDGSLITEGHSLRPDELLDWAKTHGPVTKVDVLWADNTWLYDQGNLPGQLKSVKLQK